MIFDSMKLIKLSRSSISIHQGIKIRCRLQDLLISISQVQNAAFGALKDEVMDLTCKVKQLSKERDYLEKELNTSQVGKCYFFSMTKVIKNITNLQYDSKLLHNLLFSQRNYECVVKGTIFWIINHYDMKNGSWNCIQLLLSCHDNQNKNLARG